jgi:hypothetical protein
MGQYAEDIIERICDQSGDYAYKDNQKDYKHYPETMAEKNIRRVRRELAILIKRKLITCPNRNQDVLIDEARKEINLKYGKGWRERGLVTNDSNQWLSFNEYQINS